MSKHILNRLRFFFFLIIIIMGVLVSRLAYLQVVQGEVYRYRSEENMLRVLSITAPRGEIFDREGVKLVSNREGFTVSVGEIPEEDKERVISFLSEELDKEVEEIEKVIREQRYRRYEPVRLKTDVDIETVARIEERKMDLPGVIIEVQPIRTYVYDSLAAHILGYLGDSPVSSSYVEQWKNQGYEYKYGDITGQEGIEKVWEPHLRGQDGGILVEVNSAGRLIRTRDKNDPVPGNDLYLTLDYELQRDTERILKEQLTHLQEKEGYSGAQIASAVVMDPNSGRILAMVSHPGFNLNTFNDDYKNLATDPLQPLFNRTIKGGYPGGSTFKMVTGAAALEEGQVRPTETLRCQGSLSRYNVTKSCFRGTVHGPVNMYQAITRSCNVYFYEMGLRVGINNLAYYAGEFGFGRPTGLRDIPGERPGAVASRERKLQLYGQGWVPGETMDAAIGQGFHEFTPLQMANYVSLIANGGRFYRPYLVEKVVSLEEDIIWQAEPEFHRIDISDETINVLRRGMEGVTQPGGTASFMANLPLKVAGKTGSAEIARGQPTHALFVGYAPADNPEIAFAVVVERSGTGGSSAAPVAERIIRSYFSLDDLKDEDEEEPVVEGEERRPEVPVEREVPAERVEEELTEEHEEGIDEEPAGEPEVRRPEELEEEGLTYDEEELEEEPESAD